MRKGIILSLIFSLASIAFSCYLHAEVTPDCMWAADSLWYHPDTPRDTSKIDVLYFVSTNVLSASDSQGKVVWQSQLTPSDLKSMNKEVSYIVRSMFHDDFNVLAPFYHQYTFDAIWQLDPKGFNAIYQNVVREACEAFDYYMEHSNNGRPFILAGFSQGAALSLDVLRHMTDQQYSRMIACYTIGYRLTAEDLAHPHINAATGEGDRGVVISFNSVQNTEAIWPRIAEGAVACINPVNWCTDQTPATFTFKGTTNEVHVDTLSHVLVVKTDTPSFYYAYYDKAPFYLDAGVSRDNLHHWDLQFYSNQIHDNALLRAGHVSH